MYQIDNKKFGAFISELRREQNLTQKDLADKLFVSDKTVSKWERGLSMPSVTLLIPIADVLGVTVTELLKGERLDRQNPMDLDDMEEIVTSSLGMVQKEAENRKAIRRKWLPRYLLCVLIAGLEIVILNKLGLILDNAESTLFLVCGLTLGFGAYFCFVIKDTLPVYYDENKINFYTDGFFRMNMPGLYFNNSNWPHIVSISRIWLLSVPIIYPVFYGLINYWVLKWANEPLVAMSILMISVFAAIFSWCIPLYVIGKKYE